MPVAPESITAQWSTARSRYLLQFDNDNAVAREIGRSGWMSVKVTRNEWLRRFQQGMSTVDDDDDDDDDGAVDNVDAVEIDRVLGLPLVETVGDGCGGGIGGQRFSGYSCGCCGGCGCCGCGVRGCVCVCVRVR